MNNTTLATREPDALAAKTRRRMNPDLRGARFGKLVVIQKQPTAGRPKWLCRCDCGATKEALAKTLLNGGTQSCGCLRIAFNQKRSTHGQAQSSEYRTWAAMITRTTNEKHRSYHNYGGRGIKVCERWLHSFQNFLDDMGSRPTPEHSIDRIDVNGNYEPGNCRWITMAEQAANRRDARHITHAGRTMNSAAWSKISGVHKQAIYCRFFEQGWTAEKAIFTPLNRKTI